jgi:hypothetical protein
MKSETLGHCRPKVGTLLMVPIFFNFPLADVGDVADIKAGQATANILKGLRLWKGASPEAAPGPEL